MKTLKLLAYFVALTTYATAQNNSITNLFDSILKSNTSINIDSLKQEASNLNYADIEFLNHTATAHYVYMDKGNVKSALKDMESNLSFEEWIEKYPNTKVEQNLLIVKSDYALNKNKSATNYCSVPNKNTLPRSIISNKNITESKGKWIINYSARNKFSDEFLIGFYFTSNFGIEALVEHYPKVIAYGDAIEEKTNTILNGFNKEPALNRILSFLEKLIDVCAAIVINYNNPDIIRYAVANIMVPKMVKSSNGFQK